MTARPSRTTAARSGERPRLPGTTWPSHVSVARSPGAYWRFLSSTAAASARGFRSCPSGGLSPIPPERLGPPLFALVSLSLLSSLSGRSAYPRWGNLQPSIYRTDAERVRCIGVDSVYEPHRKDRQVVKDREEEALKRRRMFRTGPAARIPAESPKSVDRAPRAWETTRA
jgi:hypothetical protein